MAVGGLQIKEIIKEVPVEKVSRPQHCHPHDLPIPLPWNLFSRRWGTEATR
jgi:hypothetical protein